MRIKTQGVFFISINTKNINKMANKTIILRDDSNDSLWFSVSPTEENTALTTTHFHNHTVKGIDENGEDATYRFFYAQKLNSGYDSEVNELWVEKSSEYSVWKDYFLACKEFDTDISIVEDLSGNIITTANFTSRTHTVSFEKQFQALDFDLIHRQNQELDEKEVQKIVNKMKERGYFADEDYDDYDEDNSDYEDDDTEQE